MVGLGFSITLAETALALLALRLGHRLWTGRATPGRWPLLVPFAAWAAASIVSAGLSPDPLLGLRELDDLLTIVAFYVILDAVSTPGAATRLVLALLGVMVLPSLMGVLQSAACPVVEALAPLLPPSAAVCGRARGFYSIYMTLAGVLSVVLLAVLPRIAGAGRRTAWSVAGWLVGAAALACTQVRGAWLGFVVGAGAALSLLRQHRAIVTGAVAVLVVGILVVPPLRERARSIVDPADPTARERWAMWQAALRMAADHPLVGVGPGQVRREYPRYALPEYRTKRRGHLHSTPVHVLVERGALGLAAWASIFAAFFWRAGAVLAGLPAGAAERPIVVGSMAAIGGFLVGGLAEYNFGDTEVVLVAYTAMALSFAAARGRAPTEATP